MGHVPPTCTDWRVATVRSTNGTRGEPDVAVVLLVEHSWPQARQLSGTIQQPVDYNLWQRHKASPTLEFTVWVSAIGLGTPPVGAPFVDHNGSTWRKSWRSRRWSGHRLWLSLDFQAAANLPCHHAIERPQEEPEPCHRFGDVRHRGHARPPMVDGPAHLPHRKP